MRILYFTRDYTAHDHRFLSTLAETGHEIFSLRLEKRGAQREDRPLPPQVMQVVWDGGTAPVERGEYRKYAGKFRHVLEQIKPDVVHAGSIQTAALVAAMAGTSNLVSMSWGYDMLMDARSTPQLRKDTVKVLDHSKVVVCDCDAVREAVMSFGFPEGKIVQFPWGTDVDHFNPDHRESQRRSLGWTEEQFILLSLRAWEPIYDVETVVRAFAKVVRQEPALYLVLLGGGSQQNYLRQLLIQAGVMDCVLFGGRVSYAQLPKYYASADVYVSASLTDGSSVSLLEAFACGTPAILSDIPGNREWLREGKEGWFFPVGDVGALAEKMLQAYQLRNQLEVFRGNARGWVVERADWKKNFLRLIEAYQMAIEEC